MSKTDIWMPLYIADYLADTTRLTAEQHGAYLLLIMDYWRNGPLPDDDAALANITRLSSPAWKKHRPTIARLFQVAEGEWRHKRIDEELHEAGANAKKNAERAKKAAAVRWGKEHASDAVSTPAGNAEMNADSNAPSNARAMLEQCPSPSPSPSPSESNQGRGNYTEIHSGQGAMRPAAGEVCKRLIELGIERGTCNPGHATLAALLEAGAQLAEFEGAARAAIFRGKKSFAYVLGTVKRQREEASALALRNGPMPRNHTEPPRRSKHDERADVIGELTGKPRNAARERSEGAREPRVITPD